jgi:hypothetical protein
MYFYRHAGGSLLRLIHDKIGILMLVFFVVHIVLNWEWIVCTTKKLCKKGKEIEEIEIIDKDYFPTN